MTSPVPLDSAAAEHAVEVAPRVWWVGDVIVGDPFQCHAYLIEAGEHSMLIDPGSSLTIEATLRKIVEVVPLDHIQWIVLHHSDPDVADSLHRLSEVLPREDAQVITEWRSALLLRHFAGRFPFVTIEDLGWRFRFPDGRELEFLLTPYLHFPGAFVTSLIDEHALFTADLFGGFNRANRLWALDARDFEDLRQFHEHYMPSREILMAGLASISASFPDIECVLPQHGYLIPRQLVGAMFDQLAKLECGMMLISRSDTHLARLLTLAAGVRHIEDLLDLLIPLDEMMAEIFDELALLLPLREFWVEAADHEGVVVRFDQHEPIGAATLGWTASAGDTHPLTLPGKPDEAKVVVVLVTTEHWDLAPELAVLLSMTSGRVRKVIDDALRSRVVHNTEVHLREEATHDPLTGLLNRRALDTHHRISGDTAVLMIDIDHFKLVNDTHGHQVGDRVLRAVADAVTESLRHSDVAIRYGGEELLAIVALDPATPARDAARHIADRIREHIAGIPPTEMGVNARVTVSIGAALVEGDETMEAVVQRADTALYRAKDAGRNCTVVYERSS